MAALLPPAGSVQGESTESESFAGNISEPTGRVLPFPASLLRDDLRVDAYVDLATVPSLQNIYQIKTPLLSTITSHESLALSSSPLQTANHEKSENSLLVPKKLGTSTTSHSNTSLQTELKSCSNIRTNRTSLAILYSCLDALSSSSLDVTAGLPEKFPYKLPDLVANHLRRRRLLEYEIKHPDVFHTRVITANFSRTIIRKPEEILAGPANNLKIGKEKNSKRKKRESSTI
ncbi:hypothetical protein HK100_006866, partial [Physocladia obscura]